MLQSYVPIFNKSIAQSFTHLDKQIDKGEFDIHDYVTEVMMTAILSRFSIFIYYRLYNHSRIHDEYIYEFPGSY